MPTTRSGINGERISRKRSSDTHVIEAMQSSSSSNNNGDICMNMPMNDGGGVDGLKYNNGNININNKKKSAVIPRPKLRVRIKKYHGVAHWTWNCGEDDDVCGICQSAYEGVAPGAKFPGDECPVVWGRCGHSFHIQCVTTWLTTKSTCPFCRVEWEFGANTNE